MRALGLRLRAYRIVGSLRAGSDRPKRIGTSEPILNRFECISQEIPVGPREDRVSIFFSNEVPNIRELLRHDRKIEKVGVRNLGLATRALQEDRTLVRAVVVRRLDSKISYFQAPYARRRLAATRDIFRAKRALAPTIVNADR